MQQTMPYAKKLWSQGIASKAQAERNKLIVKVAVLLIVILASALFCVWSRVRIVQMGYEVSNLQKNADELSKKFSHLNVEVERLKSPQRLGKVASEFLNMHPPSNNEIVFVEKEMKGQN